MLLPEGLEFGKPGWWLTHALFILFVFSYGYRKGRRDERKSYLSRTAGVARDPGVATEESGREAPRA